MSEQKNPTGHDPVEGEKPKVLSIKIIRSGDDLSSYLVTVELKNEHTGLDLKINSIKINDESFVLSPTDHRLNRTLEHSYTVTTDVNLGTEGRVHIVRSLEDGRGGWITHPSYTENHSFTWP